MLFKCSFSRVSIDNLFEIRNVQREKRFSMLSHLEKKRGKQFSRLRNILFKFSIGLNR